MCGEPSSAPPGGEELQAPRRSFLRSCRSRATANKEAVPSFTPHASVRPTWGLFDASTCFPGVVLQKAISSDSVFAFVCLRNAALIGRQIRRCLKKLNVSQLFDTEPTERTDPRCIQRAPRAKSIRSVDGQRKCGG